MGKHDISSANELLLNNIEKIRTVTEWADMMGYEPSDFSRKYRNRNNIVAVKALTLMRIVKLEEHLSNKDCGIMNYELARMVGLRDEKDLYNFMTYHVKCSPTKFREKIASRRNGNNKVADQASL